MRGTHHANTLAVHESTTGLGAKTHTYTYARAG
eukprot:COSAG06_NODE_462_length_15394_cov_16.361164_6_plen_33_part_00